jgi:hypothetical protein
MAQTDDAAPVYVSPDKQSEMPVRSPATRINLESRGWTRKDGGAPVSTSANPITDETPKRPATRREATDK